MADNKFELQVFCTEHNLIRSTYFSDTYRAAFELDGVTKSWDITHISLPFSKEKERLLQARFDISSDKLFEFYKRFAKCVQNSMAIVKYINDIPLEEQSQTQDSIPRRDPAVAVKGSAALYKYKRIIKKADKHGSDVYLVTETLDPFVGSEFCTGTAISLNNLLSFAARATQIINGFAYYGFHIGSFDLDTIFLQNVDGKKFFTFGSFLYAGFDQDRIPKTWKTPAWPDMKELPTLPASTDQSVKEGGAPSLVGDMHSLVALLWTVLSGKNYRDSPDYEEPPRYAPAELLEVLVQGRDSNDPDTLRLMSKRFHALMRSIRRQEIPDTIIHMAEAPDYLTQYFDETGNEVVDISSGTDVKGEAIQDQTAQSGLDEVMSQQPVDTDADSQQIQPEQTSNSEEPIQAEIVAEVVAVTLSTTLATKAAEQHTTKTFPDVDTDDTPSSIEKDAGKTTQEAILELPQKTEMAGMAVDVQQGEESPAESKEIPSGELAGDERAPERDSAFTGVQVHESELSERPEEKSCKNTVYGTEELHEDTLLDEAKEQTAVSATAQYEEVAVDKTLVQPVECKRRATKEVYRPEQVPQIPEDEQQMGTKENIIPPSDMTTPTERQPSMFQRPIFIPVPYGQTGGQQGFMAVYPPQVIDSQRGVPTIAQQFAAAPQPAPTTTVQPKDPQQEPVTGSIEPTVEPKARVVAETPASTPVTKQKPIPASTHGSESKPTRKVIRRTITTYQKPKKQSKVGTFFLIFLLIAILALLGMSAVQYMGYDVPYDIPFIDELRGVADFTITPEAITIHVGEEVVLSSSEGCTLSSSDHNVAVVSDTGHVRGVGAGTCTITARASSSSSVVRIPVTVL